MPPVTSPTAVASALTECHILLIEKKSTQHTGDVKTEKTRSLAEQLRPV